MRLVKTMQTTLMRLTPILHRRRRQPKNQFKNGMKMKRYTINTERDMVNGGLLS